MSIILFVFFLQAQANGDRIINVLRMLEFDSFVFTKNRNNLIYRRLVGIS